MVTFMGIVMILIGGLSVLSTIQSRRKAEQARTWRTVDASIVKSVVDISGSVEDRSVYPRVEYTYEVGGEEFSGNTITFATAYTESDSLACVRKYPAGTTVKLRYNPDNVSESCLETGAKPRTFLFLIGSIMIVGIGIALLLFGSVLGIVGHPGK